MAESIGLNATLDEIQRRITDSHKVSAGSFQYSIRKTEGSTQNAWGPGISVGNWDFSASIIVLFWKYFCLVGRSTTLTDAFITQHLTATSGNREILARSWGQIETRIPPFDIKISGDDNRWTGLRVSVTNITFHAWNPGVSGWDSYGKIYMDYLVLG